MSADSITVIVPTRHRPDYLTVAVLSIQASAAELLRQYGVPTTIVVVDDAPDDDGSKDAAAALGVSYLRVTEHDGRRDPGAAIVLGVQNVQTRYQTIFGDDDIMLPRHLSAAYEMLARGYDVVSCSFRLTNEELVPRRTVILEPTCIGDLVAGHVMVNDGSFVAHDLVKDLEWDVSLEAQMLVPVWGHLMVEERMFGIVEEPTWLYRRHEENISANALTPRDLELRARARERLTKEVLASIGHIPASPRSAMLARKEAKVAYLKTHPLQKNYLRVRNKAARMTLQAGKRMST